MKTEREQAQKSIAENRKAFHDYHILETFEAGVALLDRRKRNQPRTSTSTITTAVTTARLPFIPALFLPGKHHNLSQRCTAGRRRVSASGAP